MQRPSCEVLPGWAECISTIFAGGGQAGRGSPGPCHPDGDTGRVVAAGDVRDPGPGARDHEGRLRAADGVGGAAPQGSEPWVSRILNWARSRLSILLLPS